MYVIVVYDVGVERVSKVCSYLRCFLAWVQNSVFEGELTESQFMRVESGLKEIIDASVDSVRIYILRSQDAVKVKTIGVEKAQIGTII
ncbi:MAG: CRISPR-associated endonuclease Cas2 [Thermoplasmata archaeon]|nr:CRISPR-associated endonuclease Cas2 [Thermoplasmata archaeon]